MTEHLLNVCKIGCGNECCRYLVGGSEGFECAKADPTMKAMIDNNWENTLHIAQGDNCDGVSDFTILNARTTSPPK